MGLRWLYRRRRAGGRAALLGMAFYALLVPVHTVSQARIGVAEGQAAAKIPCHEADRPDAGNNDSKPAGKTKCPICLGYAALDLAVAFVAPALFEPSDIGMAAIDASTWDYWNRARTAQSRGPPPRST
jgi:hypothetical protein